MSKFVKLEPTPTEYARMLVLLVRDSENLEDRKWAGDELVRIVGDMEKRIESLQEDKQ
jgi:hypothetical protein